MLIQCICNLLKAGRAFNVILTGIQIDRPSASVQMICIVVALMFVDILVNTRTKYDGNILNVLYFSEKLHLNVLRKYRGKNYMSKSEITFKSLTKIFSRKCAVVINHEYS